MCAAGRSAPRGSRFAQLAVALAVVSAGVLVVSCVHQHSAHSQQVALSEGWEGWLEGLETPFGVGKEPHTKIAKMQASMVPTTGAINLASSLGNTIQLKTWVATGVENFARACGKDRSEGCPTGQSSTAADGAAKRAVENGNQSSYVGSACTHTQAQPNPWWKVNFQRQITVKGLRIYNRGDCCQDSLQGFDVWVGNHNYQPDANYLCVKNQSYPATYVDITCDTPIKGTYLYVSLPGANKELTLCEVQVTGSELPPDEGGYDPWGISNQGNPRPDQLPTGASRNTWANIVNNKKNLLWCTEQFRYLGNRERCIHSFSGGPLLANDPHQKQAVLDGGGAVAALNGVGSIHGGLQALASARDHKARHEQLSSF